MGYNAMDRNTQAPLYFCLCEDFGRNNAPLPTPTLTLTLNLHLSNSNLNSKLNLQTTSQPSNRYCKDRPKCPHFIKMSSLC